MALKKSPILIPFRHLTRNKQHYNVKYFQSLAVPVSQSVRAPNTQDRTQSWRQSVLLQHRRAARPHRAMKREAAEALRNDPTIEPAIVAAMEKLLPLSTIRSEQERDARVASASEVLTDALVQHIQTFPGASCSPVNDGSLPSKERARQKRASQKKAGAVSAGSEPLLSQGESRNAIAVAEPSYTLRRMSRSASAERRKAVVNGNARGNNARTASPNHDAALYCGNEMLKAGLAGPVERPSDGVHAVKRQWWRQSRPRVTLPDRVPLEQRKKLLRGFVMALVRSCIREAWSADTLLACYNREPASSRGEAYYAASASLLLFERARHMGQCRTRWRPELLNELLKRPRVQWQAVEQNEAFDQFTGCEVCLLHRPSTRKLILSGARYDARSFWASSSQVAILSTADQGDGGTAVAVEMTATQNHVAANADRPDDGTISEFYVDQQCLRRCLLFHELVHCTSRIAGEIRILLEDEVCDGLVEIPGNEKNTDDASIVHKGSVQARLERHLVQKLSENNDFLNRIVNQLSDAVQLGDKYFINLPTPHSRKPMGEVKGKPRNIQVHLGAEDLSNYGLRSFVQRLEARCEKRDTGTSYATFCL